MDILNNIYAQYGLAGVGLFCCAWFLRWFLLNRLPSDDARREQWVMVLVDVLKDALADLRADHLTAQKEQAATYTDSLARVERFMTSRADRHDAGLDAAQQHLVSLRAEVGELIRPSQGATG